jgi:3-oxoacyl-[acyl-carrier protein] reductase
MAASEPSVSRAIILTGAAGVLGTSMGLALLRAGHRVVLTDIEDGPLQKLGATSGAPPGNIAVCAADLTTPAGPERVVRAAHEAFGRVDMLINNAAFTAFAAWPDDRLRPNAWTLDTAFVRRFFEINTIAPHALAHLVLPQMLERKWGRVVNVTCSYDTMQRIFPYGAAKAALEGYTSSIEIQLAHSGVTANTLNPGGPVATELHMQKNPGRKWVQPAVMNAPILWLASDDSNGIAGRRYVGTKWDPELPWRTALERASGPFTWKGFGDEPVK